MFFKNFTSRQRLGKFSRFFRGLSVSIIGMGSTEPPAVFNQPMLDFAPGSPERVKLLDALSKMRKKIETSGPFKIPVVIGGKEITTNDIIEQQVPFDHKIVIAQCSKASPDLVQQAIQNSLLARREWDAMPLDRRSSIFLKAAELLVNKYRYEVAAATMIGQAKNIWQAEIDCVCEAADFLRFYCDDAFTLSRLQPHFDTSKCWNRIEYRGLDGFVYVVSPFNFTAIALGLCASPAIMGNVVLWKPSSFALYSNYLCFKILREAGLPDGVINFIPGDARQITETVINHKMFCGLHFTGGTAVFDSIWESAGKNVSRYLNYPVMVGETGGKNMHVIHESADLENVVNNTVRAAFEYSGQKCSAVSRVYVPRSISDKFKMRLVEEVKKIKVGSIYDSTNFVSALINKAAYERVTGYIKNVGTEKDPNTKIIAGGEYSDAEGYFVHPTVLETTDLRSPTMVNELFGPVVTLYVYDTEKYEETLRMASDETTDYALTASIFANDVEAINKALEISKQAAGNFYINDKCTGAIVGHQPFGGARKSGTNNKAGTLFNLVRWTSLRTIKENLCPTLTSWGYPSNEPQVHEVKNS